METIVRPNKLDCIIHRADKGANKYIVIVGLNNGNPFEIFVAKNRTLNIPEYATSGEISISINDLDIKQYDLVVKDKMGYNLQIDGINRVMDKELHNYAITISFLLRYSPLEVVKHLITKWQDVSVDSLIISEFKDVLLEVLNQYQQVINDSEKPLIIEVEKCLLCPYLSFACNSEEHYCGFNENTIIEKNDILDNCPLKKENHLIELK